MRIIHIIPGFGGTFYCQNCMRDNYMSDKLKDLGHEVIIVPMYMPHEIENIVNRSRVPVFYGALNVFLEEKFPLFRKAPEWIKKILNSVKLLKWVSKNSGSTDALGLEEMTLSVLQGKEGHQANELNKLVEWLRSKGKPDIVHLSNSLLIGLAKPIKNMLRIPVFCTLQDEDKWIDSMEPRYSRIIWKIISDKVADVDMFISVSKYYALKMQKQMNIPAKKISVIPIGINIPDCKIEPRPMNPPTIGYLSRLSVSLGLDILIQAFILLKKDDKFKDLQLKATGGSVGKDKRYIKSLEKQLKKNGILDSVEFIPNDFKSGLCKFLQSCSILSVPVPGGEAFGTYIIEALSVGVPVVQPEEGAYPELIKATGGGITYTPNTPEKLAEALRSLLLNPEKLNKLGARGRKIVLQKYNIESMVRNMDRLYRRYLK